MSKVSSLRSPSLLALLTLAAVLALFPSWVLAKGCIDSLPEAQQSRMPPSSLWGNLVPKNVIIDKTAYNGVPRADSRWPQITSVDIENGYLFASYWAGFTIYDLRSNPENPTAVLPASQLDGWSGAFPQWVPGQQEIDQFIYAIDAPEGDDSIAAVGGISPMGLSIWDTSNKAAPVALYQDAFGKEIQQLYSTTINGRAYTFAGGSGDGTEWGLFVYDMTAARSYKRCVEDVTHGQRNCPGVYVGKIGTANDRIQYVQGMHFGSKTFVAVSTGSAPTHFVRIYDVSNPASPTLVVAGFAGTRIDTLTRGVALWQQGSSAYLAVRMHTALQIFDVTSCLTNGCGSLPAAIGNFNLSAAIDESPWHSTIYSKAGNTPMLFLGNHDLCHIGEGNNHTEYVLDVSNPANPTDITPSNTSTFSDGTTSEPVDYWTWYYSDAVKGFAFSAPRGGKFYNASNGNVYLYRADLTLFDVHQWMGGGSLPPTANFTWTPSTVYTGDQVTFTDTSTGSVTTRSWDFQDGSSNGTTGSSQVVTFATAGPRNIGLTVGNSVGSHSTTKQITVLNPAPAVQSVTPSATTAPVCSSITWTANGVTGRAPLTVSWSFTNGANQAVATGSGSPYTWDTTGQAAGTYTGTVTVSGSGTPATANAQITLVAPDPLPGAGQFTATKDPFSFGTVTFHAGVTGATSWNWDFGDGQGYRGWTGPYAVANPTFTYTAVGTYQVKVKVKNCVQPVEVESAPLAVSVTQVQPLVIDTFQAQCNFAPCVFSTGDTINFSQAILGGPNTIQYDWDGNGSWDQTVTVTGSVADTITHVYNTVGSYAPKIRAIRGSEPPVDYTHPTFSVSSGGNGGGGGGGGGTATLSISGAASGNPGQALTYSATASNCTPSSSWTWHAGDGTISGTGSSVSVTWPTTGTKSVSVTNTGCSGATGSKTVSINTGGGGGGGGLAAAFNFSPAAPNPGQAVSFDGSSSTGSPTVYTWDFGDGSARSSSTSATTSHTYANAGTYNVILEVGKQGADCPFGVCSATVTKTVTVSGAPALQVTLDTDADCISDFAGQRCMAETGKAVSFTATSAGATSFAWNFGDTGTASGIQASHTWTAPGTFLVQITVSDGRTTASASRTFIVTGNPIAGKKAAILPWIAQSRGALVQSSDLYLHNPSANAMDVILTFRRLGQPESNPPQVRQTIQPGATLYAGDVLRQMFNRENISGFITVDVDKGGVEPVITSFNTTYLADGSEFGQTVPGLSMSSAGAAAGTQGATTVQNIVGLNDNPERLAYFGISNPGTDVVSFTLRFFDSEGHQIGDPHDLAVANLGQRQFLVKNIRDLFGVSNQDDYRVEIRSTGGSSLYPYGANLRLASADPSFVGASTAGSQRVYLVGALSTPGINKSLWQSDVVISNTSSEVVNTEVTFTGAGSATQPTAPLKITLQPGETRRLADVIGQQWGIRNMVGVITVQSSATGGVYPIVQGESYENTKPTRRFGQTLPAMTDSQAAGPGASQYLVGLRQDAKNRTTVWLLNTSDQIGSCDLIFLGLDGKEIGRLSDVLLAPGKLRQFSPNQQTALPAAGVADGYTIQVKVKSGKVLAAAQVVKNATNDPAYIQGATR